MLQRQPPGGGHPRRSVAGVCSLVITSHHLQAASPRSASWAAAASTPAPSCQPSRWRARSAWRSTGSSWRRSSRRRAWGITEKRLASCDLITFWRNKFIFIDNACPSRRKCYFHSDSNVSTTMSHHHLTSPKRGSLSLLTCCGRHVTACYQGSSALCTSLHCLSRGRGRVVRSRQ